MALKEDSGLYAAIVRGPNERIESYTRYSENRRKCEATRGEVRAVVVGQSFVTEPGCLQIPHGPLGNRALVCGVWWIRAPTRRYSNAKKRGAQSWKWKNISLIRPRDLDSHANYCSVCRMVLALTSISRFEEK